MQKIRKSFFGGGWDNIELIREVEQKKKIKFVTSSSENVKKNLKVEHITTLLGKSDMYYIVIFPKETQAIRDMFVRFGYSEDNLFFVYHKPILVQKDGRDKYGNVTRGVEKYGYKVRCYFEGYGGNVNLGDEINITSKLKISIGNEAIVSVADGVKFYEDFSILARNLNQNKCSRIKVGERCSFNRGRISSFSGKINLNNDSTFGNNFMCACTYGMSVDIGSDCMFSHEIYVLAGDGHTLYDTQGDKVMNSVDSMPKAKKELAIRNHVWVGFRSVILNGTDVGIGSMIGAASLVKGKYPNNCMIVGNPVKILKKNIAWSRNPVPVDDAKMYENEVEYYNMTMEEGALYEC